MITESMRARMEAALQASSPVIALSELARTLKTEGMSQQEMKLLFDQYRVRHESDVDETKYDAILDTMDLICCGQCHPKWWLFDSPL